jgi:hypothetical protein
MTEFCRQRKHNMEGFHREQFGGAVAQPIRRSSGEATMSPRIFQRQISLVGLLAVAVAPLSADEKPDRETTERITHLIGMLTSRNPAPKIVDMGGYAEATLDKAYDKNLQVPVYLAMQQLLAEGDAALELLLRHEDDKGYCLSVTNCDYDENRTVGFICMRIFWANIRPFGDDLHFMTKGGRGEYPILKGKSLKDWWAAKKKIGLARVQIEAIDAELDFVQKADARKATGPIPDAPPLSSAEFEEARKQNIRFLKAMRETILSTGQPYRPRTCISTLYEQIIGLPWSGVTRK